MKRTIVLFLILSITFVFSAQTEHWKQKNARIGFIVQPEMILGNQYVSYCQKFGVSFNNTFSSGLFIDFNKNELSFLERDYMTQNIYGIFIDYNMRLGLYRTKAGHYVIPNTRIYFSSTFGGGTFAVAENNELKKYSNLSFSLGTGVSFRVFNSGRLLISTFYSYNFSNDYKFNQPTIGLNLGYRISLSDLVNNFVNAKAEKYYKTNRENYQIKYNIDYSFNDTLHGTELFFNISPIHLLPTVLTEINKVECESVSEIVNDSTIKVSVRNINSYRSNSKNNLKIIIKDDGQHPSFFANEFVKDLSDKIVRQGKDYALFFAVKDYFGQKYRSLANPIKDANEIAKEMFDIYGFDTLVFRNPDKMTIKENLEKYYEKTYTDDDQLFIYFSGHGDSLLNNSYFIPYTSQGKENEDYALAELISTIDGIKCKHIFLMIDACHSSSFNNIILFKGATRPGETDFTKAQQVIQEKMKITTRLAVTSGKGNTEDGINHSPLTEKFLEFLGGLNANKEELYLTYLDFVTLIDKSMKIRNASFGKNEIGSTFIFVKK